MPDKLNLQNIVQIAYYVDNVESAAKKAHETFGTGPFFIYRHIKLREVSYRGSESELDHSSAYAQAGPLMIEFTQQHNDAPSTFSEMFEKGEEGFHHAAIFVDNVSGEMNRLQALGFDTVTHYFTCDGDVEVAFIDTRPVLGHMLEIYKPVEALSKFYDAVARSAQKWDGLELFRYIN
ncbi:MAG: hypothetical protein GKR93_18435 [Gammaproteobacteria bacterium]|nr:hypothetical protein [Gammaproteobacteria bacterium]